MSDNKGNTWETATGEEINDMLSSEERAVIDEAISIADGVLGHAQETKQAVPNQPILGQPIVKSPDRMQPVSSERTKPIRLIVTNDVSQQTPIHPKDAVPKQAMPAMTVSPVDAQAAGVVPASVAEAAPAGAVAAEVAGAVPVKAIEEAASVAADAVKTAGAVPAPTVAAEMVEAVPAPTVAAEMAGAVPAATVVAEVGGAVPAATVAAEMAGTVAGPVSEPGQVSEGIVPAGTETLAADETQVAATVEPMKLDIAQQEPVMSEPSMQDDAMKLGELFAGTDMDHDMAVMPVRDLIDEKPKRKVRTWTKVLLGVMIFLCILVGAGAFFINVFLDRINIVQPTIAASGNQDNNGKLGNMDVDLILKNEGVRAENDDTVEVNYDGDENLSFLLIGEEAIGSTGTYGRSDSMMVLTVNTEKKTVRLLSFMRDLYVNIPGYGMNRLNAAYQLGGSELVGKTLNANFGIYVDGYVKVNFEGFSDIIDAIGGVDVELTEEEAEYLNTTNYISKKKYRTVKPGKQTLNGNQALGYCRVRKRACITGENNDYGRTARQRLVISNIFDKVKNMRLFDMLGLAYDSMPMITTNIPKKQIISYVKLAASLNLKKIKTSRIPADGMFTGQTVKLGNVDAQVLVPDLAANTQALVEFLYGGEVPVDVQKRINEAAAQAQSSIPNTSDSSGTSSTGGTGLGTQNAYTAPTQTPATPKPVRTPKPTTPPEKVNTPKPTKEPVSAEPAQDPEKPSGGESGQESSSGEGTEDTTAGGAQTE